MRFGPHDKFHVVVDPSPTSQLGDFFFETTLTGLELQFRGGLSMAQNPAIFSDREEAEHEARNRPVALRAAQAVLRSARESAVASAHRIELYDEAGQLVARARLEA